MTADKILIARSAAGRLSIAIGMPVRNRLRVLAAGCLVLGALLALAGCAPTPARDFSHPTQETTNGDFAAALIVPVGNKPMTVATADFDNDGFLDIAVTNQLAYTADPADPALAGAPGTLTVLLNDGLGGFSAPDAAFSLPGPDPNLNPDPDPEPDAGIRPSRVLAGLLNGDAIPDLVFLHTEQAHADGSTHADEGFHQDNSFIRVLINNYPLPGWSSAEIDLTGLI
ncbi:MAG: VCBS repeat-containing protein, partial [bacterium]